MEKYLEIGKIVNTHGVRGELKVIPLTDDPRRYDDLEWVFVGDEGSMVKYHIEGVKYFKGTVIVKFKGIDDMNAAEKLKNLYIKVDRENAVKLQEGSYFVCDLLGCEVYEEEGHKLGILTDVLQTGSNDVYVVRNEDNNREVLVPALRSVVKQISVEDRKIIVNLPEGL
ncbi:MAG: ribosome maturation factor RimM [Clostridiales bacterium]|jgi:16S rRNA processing protein RimM|nr:ribosome maturation factor RimM [Eubacteriales bacterium]MDH7565097.1 ribosome maturation factor RimM [Clostridiales bacterium]